VTSFVDLHCHWVPAIDDGARSVEAALAMLAGLKSAGFELVVATPHLRDGMFASSTHSIQAAYAKMLAYITRRDDMPAVALASEHYFDAINFERLRSGRGLPYVSYAFPDGAVQHSALDAATRSVLIELPQGPFPPQLEQRFGDLRRSGLRVVLAHPERQQPVWANNACLDPLLDAGALLLLDVCSLIGKYGRNAQRAAEALLDDGAYEAACSDAHRPDDIEQVCRAIDVLVQRAGRAEADRLLSTAPRAILQQIPTSQSI